MNNEVPNHFHYFLDEAGDHVFYGKGKKIILGTAGVSAYFILGMVSFNGDVRAIREKVVELQKQIVNDTYFDKIGSINKKKKSHGFYFHATDDVPEVRMLFFNFIKSLDCRFEAIVGNKIPDLFIKKHNGNEKEFYADLLSHLLNDKLGLDRTIVLNVARLGESTRKVNLDFGLQKAVNRFQKNKPEVAVNSKIVFNVQDQTTEPLLNIADYFCWAVQRVFEMGELRYYDYLKEKITVVDLYDTNAVKNIYNAANPLTEGNKKSPLAT